MKSTQDITPRLKIARGHLDKVIEMVERGKYCINVLQQSIAVQNALKRADEKILSRHLQICVKKALSNEEKDKQVTKILEVFKRGRR